jgi:hypothetical protein
MEVSRSLHDAQPQPSGSGFSLWQRSEIGDDVPDLILAELAGEGRHDGVTLSEHMADPAAHVGLGPATKRGLMKERRGNLLQCRIVLSVFKRPGRWLPVSSVAGSARSAILLKGRRQQAHKRHDRRHILRAHDLSQARHRSSAVSDDAEHFRVPDLILRGSGRGKLLPRFTSLPRVGDTPPHSLSSARRVARPSDMTPPHAAGP